MSIITLILAGIVALEHLYIMYLETFATHSDTTSRVFNMSKEELEGFFNKYNISELEAFKVIMQYVYDYEKEEIEKILNSVKNNKEQNYKEVCFKEEFNLSNITDKNDLLNDKELVFLYKIVNDALLCLSSIKHMDVEYETIETSKIENSLYDKISRKSNGIKMLKLIEE